MGIPRVARQEHALHARYPRDVSSSTTSTTTISESGGGGGIDKGLLGGLLFLALFLVAVVIGIVIFFMCYCRRAKRSANKYRENAAGLHRLKNESNHVSGPAVPINPDLQRNRHNVFSTFVTSKEHSEQGGNTTGMLNVQDLQRIQKRADPEEQRNSFENMGYVPTEKEPQHVEMHRQPTRGSPHNRGHQKSLTVDDRGMESYSERSVDAHDREYEYLRRKHSSRKPPPEREPHIPQQESSMENPEHRYQNTSKKYALQEDEPDVMPPNVPPRDNLPGDNNDRHSDTSDSISFTQASDGESEFDEFTISRTSVGEEKNRVNGTWAEAGSPQFHVKKPRPGMEESLVLDSNIMYESVDGSTMEGRDNVMTAYTTSHNKPSTGSTDRRSSVTTLDFHGMGTHGGLPEVEALKELDEVIRSHSDLSRIDSPPLNPVYMLPPLENKKLPPINPANVKLGDSLGPRNRDVHRDDQRPRLRERRHSTSEALPARGNHADHTDSRRKFMEQDDQRPRLRERRHSTSEEAPVERESRRQSRSRDHHDDISLRRRSSSMSRIQSKDDDDRKHVSRDSVRRKQKRARPMERASSEDNLLDKRHVSRGDKYHVSESKRHHEHSNTDDPLMQSGRTRPASQWVTSDSRKPRPDSSTSRPDSGRESGSSRRSRPDSGRSRPESAHSRTESEGSRLESSRVSESPKREKYVHDAHVGRVKEKQEYEKSEKRDSHRSRHDSESNSRSHKREHHSNGNAAQRDDVDSDKLRHRAHQSDRHHRREKDHELDDDRSHRKKHDQNHSRSEQNHHDDRHSEHRHGEHRNHRQKDRRNHKDDTQDSAARTLHAEDELYQFHKNAMLSGELSGEIVPAVHAGNGDMASTLNSTGQSSASEHKGGHRHRGDGSRHKEKNKGHRSRESSSRNRKPSSSPQGSPHRTRPTASVYLHDVDSDNYEV